MLIYIGGAEACCSISSTYVDPSTIVPLDILLFHNAINDFDQLRGFRQFA